MDDNWDSVSTPVAATSEWDAVSTPAPAKPQGSNLGDVARTVGMGAAGLGQMASNLAYAGTGSDTVKAVADKFGEWSDDLQEKLTPEMKSAIQKHFIADDNHPADAWSDPRSYLFQIANQVGSGLPMIGAGRLIGLGAEAIAGLSKLKPALSVANDAGAAASKAAMESGAEKVAADQAGKLAAQNAFSTEAAKVGVKDASLDDTLKKVYTANVAGQVAAGTYLHGSDAANAAMGSVAQMSHDDLMKSPEYADAYAGYKQTMPDDQAQAKAKEDIRRAAGLTASEVTGGAAIPWQIAMSMVHAKLFTGGMGGTSRLGNFAKAAAVDVPANAAELGSVAFGGNVGVQQHANPNQSLSEDVADTALKAGIGAIGLAAPHLLTKPVSITAAANISALGNHAAADPEIANLLAGVESQAGTPPSGSGTSTRLAQDDAVKPVPFPDAAPTSISAAANLGSVLSAKPGAGLKNVNELADFAASEKGDLATKRTAALEQSTKDNATKNANDYLRSAIADTDARVQGAADQQKERDRRDSLFTILNNPDVADKEGAFKQALKSSFPNETPALSDIEKGAIQRHADITEAFKDQSTSSKRVDQVPEVKEQKPLAKGEARPADQQIQQVKDLLAAGHTLNPSKTTLVNKAGKVKLVLNKAQREFVKTLPKESKHAVQEPSTGEILQREPGQAGGEGGERGRVEPVQQGEKAAEEGGTTAGHQENQAELIQPKGENNGTQADETKPQQAGEQKAPAASSVKESPPQPNEPTPQTAEIGAAPTLTIGKTPKSTEPITVKNGVIHIGAYPVQNYETGEDITVPEGATPREIKEALKAAGAIGKGQLIFGIPKEEPVKPETKPAAKTEVAPEPSAPKEPSSPNPEEEAKRAHEVAARAAQKDAFTELSGVQALHDTVTNTPDAFRPSAEIELKKYLVKEGALALKSGDAVRAKAVYALLSDGKPSLPESFYDGLLKEIKQDLKQKRIESIKTLAKEELVSAMVALKIDGEANQAKFMDGWNHALAGKTKSTLANDEVTAKGYENAKAWLETEDGRAAYTGKRAKKLENTGADLRRWFDEKQAKITEGSTESIMDALDAATSRAELFRDVISPESTPGAQRWVEALRNNVLPFKRWFTERGKGADIRGYEWQASDANRIRSYLDEIAYITSNGRAESREARIQTMKQAADEYVKKVALIVDSLDGKTVSSLVSSFSEFEANQKYTNGEVINHSYTASRLADKTGYIVRDLLANESKTIESTRKAPLTPPKLDRVDRDGEDYRKGQSVTPEQFKKRFNFADVGFGKWVSGKHDQDHLNYSYDAFYDLAKQLGIPTEAMSLGGQLHFTIGALGHGKFAAHYQGSHPHPEGGTVPVINVTKTKGDGTVAHEWSHALDLTPQFKDGQRAAKYLSDAISEIKAELKFAYNMKVVIGTVHNMLTGDSYWQRSKKDKNSYEGRMEGAERAISRYGSQEHQNSKYFLAAQSLDGSNSGKDEAYWSNHKEIFARAFESWLGDVMEKSNTYLVNPGWSGDGVVTSANYRGTPYPMGDERARFNKWFDALAKSLTYDKETKVLTVDPAKWAENKPNDREQWKNDIEELKKKLPEMQRKVRDDQLAADKAKADLLAYTASLRIGDMVRAQPGKEDVFRDKFGNNGAVISSITDTGYGRMIYFDGSEHGMRASNTELVQTREELQKADRDAREAVEAQQDKPSGKLSMQDLEQMFDTAASELQESNQEKPEAPAAGEPLLATPKPATKEELSQLFKDRSGKLPNERKPIPSVSDKKALTLIAEAAKLGVKGADEALTGLAKLFGSGPGKLQSFPGSLNKETYEKAKPHFKAALKNFQEAGKTLNDLFKMLIQTLGIGIKPYAVQFAFDNDLEQNLGNKPASEAQNDRGTESESSSTLEGIPADDVGAPEGAGHSGPNAETGGDGGGEGNPRADGGGGETGRSGGNGPADVHLPETGGKESKPGSKGGRGKGRTGVSKADRGANGKPESGTDLAPGTIPAMNFTITPDLNLGKGGESEKFTDNLDAIRTLKLIEHEHRRATADEQRIIARYVGWGGIPNAFKNAITGEFKKEWKARIEELESLLSPRELKQARASTTDAHFTSETVVNFMWRAAARLGYSGGMALEPSVGVGNFLGLMPEHMRGNSFSTGIELDGITARMAAALYPQSSIINAGFQSVPLPEKTFDLAIGNPPFGQTSLRFQYNPELNGKSIHNQFFLGSINAVKPGGLQVMVVSRYLMDAQDAGTREELALKAKLLGAIRLPGSAFSENARTSVVTDILFLQRREAADEAKMMAAWAERNQKVNAKETSDQRYDREQRASYMKDEMHWTRTGKVPDSLGGDPMEVSRYYIENPHMIAGQMDRSGSMQYSDKEKGGSINVVLDKGENLADRLNGMITNLPEVPAKLLSEEVLKRTEEMHKALGESLKIIASGREVGSIFYDDSGALSTIVERLDESGKSSVSKIEITADTPWSGQLAMDNNGKWYREVPKLDENGAKVKNGKLNVYHREVFQNEADIPKGLRIGDGPLEKLKSLVGIRELFLKQISLETSSAPVKDMEANRKELNKGYDSFVKKYGFISEPKNAAIISEMPDEGLILSLESKFKREVTAAKAKATGMKQAPASAEKSAILLRPVGIPAARIDHADTIGDAIAVSLSESGRIDAQRIAQLMGKTEDEVIAEATGGEKPLAFIDPETNKLVEKNDYLSGNVRRKLEAARSANVQQNIKALEAVQPEAWPSDKVTARIGATWVPPEVYAKFMGDLLGEEARVRFSKLTNTFDVYGNHDSALATSKWGTKRFDAIKLYEAMLNSKGVAVYDTDSEGKRHFNEIESQAANDKKNELNEEFSNWVFKDSERRKMLTKLFNDIYNTRVNRQFDGSHMTFPGKVPDDVVAFRRSQTNAIWRGVVNNHVLYDHAVGAGKTFTAIARAIERKRMGISRKSMIVVPNHLVQEWAAQAYRLYPGAKVLAAGVNDLQSKNRRRMFAKIAAGDHDLVIVPHSSFQFISLSPETEERFVNEQMELASAALKEAQQDAEEEAGGGKPFKPLSVKVAEALIKKLEERLEAIRNKKGKDRLLTFEQMGVDDLTIDESHEFKNLMYSSRLPSDVRGLGTKQGSHKALDLYMKMKLLHENNGSAAFLSGTPISNSAVEMYTIMRYLAPEILKEQGLEHFDSYRTQFVDAAQAFEPTEAGNGIKIVNRLGRSWSNMRALMEGYTSVADMVTNDDIKAWYREDNPGKEFPLPNIKGGGRQAISVKPTAQQEDIIKTIITGYEGLPSISDIKERNKERLRLMDRARKVAISARTVDPRIEEEAGGKLDRVMDEALRIYKKWNSDKGTQLVFLDRSVPKSKGDDKVIKEYDDLRQKFREAVLAGNEEDQGKINDKLEKFDKDEIEELRIAQTANWNAYQHMADKLIASGIPRDEIAFIQNFSTDQQKKALFDAVNDGSVRFLFGSSPRMGAGMNVQERLVGLHHVDVDWKPSTIEQREGRIIRQGNSLYDKYGPSFDPEILAYVTERSMDAKMWDLNSTKLRMINGIRMYDGEFDMDFNDEESVGMAEIAAIASGDPLMLKRIKLSASMDDLYRKRRSYSRRVEAAQDALEDAKNDVQRIPGQIKAKTADVKVTADALQLAVKDQEKRKVMVGDKEFTTLMDALAHVSEQADKQQTVNGVRDIKLPISLSVDGKALKSEDAVQAAIADKMGDANPFISEAGTAAYSNKIIRRLELARYIRSVIGETFVEIPEWKPVGTMYGLPLSVMTETLYGNAYANLKVDLGNGNDLTAYASIMPEKHTPGTPVPVNVVSIRAIIMRLDDELRNASSFKPAYLESKLQAAQENIKTLEETVKEKFKDEGALEDTKKQLDELEKTLNNRKAGATDDDSVSLEQMGSDYESSLTKKYALWDGKEQDPLYPKALELVQAAKRGSISFVERNVHVPRDRAQRIIERMEQDGYVGPADLEGRHEVLAGSGTDIYAHQNLRSGITETQKEAGRNAYRAILSRYATDGSISLLGSAIAKDFKRQGGSALTGQIAKTIEDFAVLAQVLRDPRMETFRVFFTKEGKILSHTGISSGLPGTVTIVKPLAGESRQDALLRLYSDIRSQKEALGADGYWMVHNHPQGSPKPSKADEIVTSNFARNIPGFKGHVVLDHDEYAVIDSDGNWKVISGELPKHFNADKAEIPNVLLGRELKTNVQVAVVGKQIERKEGYFTIIGRANSGVVAAIADVPMSMMEGGKISQIRMRVLLKRFAIQTGSGDVVAVSDHLDMDKMGPLVQEGLLIDAVDTRGNSARLKLGINKDNEPKNVLFGNSDKFKSTQVNQNAAPYEAKSSAKSRAIRQDEVKPEGKLQDRIAEAAKSSIDGIKTGFASLKDAYARTPEYGDKKEIIGKLTGQYQEIDFDLAKTAKKINSEVSKSTQEAIKQYMQAGGDETVLRQRASEVPAKYRKPFDDALNLTPKDKEWAKQIYSEQQEWGTKAVEAGIIEHMIDNYVRGQWERENVAGQRMSAMANSGMLNDHPREAMRKVFQNDYEGLKAGFVPVDQRIGFQHTAAQRSIRRALAARQALTNMMTAKESDGLPMTMLGGGGSMVEESSAIQSLRNEAEKARQAAKAEPKNAELQKSLDEKYDELDAAVKKDKSSFKDKPYFVKANMPPNGAMTADGRAYVKYDHPALRGWKWIGSDAAGSPILMQGSMYIHPDSVKDIHALLGKSAVREYTVPKFVPVIGGTRPGDAALKAGAYIKATMLSGTPFHQFHIGEHAVFHGVNPMDAPELSFDRKVKINGKEYAILREGVNHGMMVYNHNALQEFGEGLSGGGLLHQVPVLGKYIQQYGEYLFQDYIPRLKAAMFEKAVLRDVEHSKAELASGKVTMDQIFQRQAKHSNDAFGEQNYKYMGRDPSLQDVLRLVALAPDFLESRMKFFGAAFTPAGREQRIALIKGALIMGLGAQLLNLMFGDDHKPHWDRPFSVIIGGREYSPRSVVGDIAHVITDPRSFLYSRINPLWAKPLIEGLSGRNQFGQKEDLQDGMNNVIKSWAPIATQGFFKNTQGQTEVQSVVGQLLATVGITNKQAKTPAEAEISDINFGHMKVAQKTAGEKKRYEGFVALKEAFMAGELNSMDDVRKQARESNLVLSKSQLQQIQSSRDITPESKLKALEQRMKSFSAEEGLMVWEKASADERAELKPFIRAKILRSHTITGADKMDALKSLND